MNNQDFKFYKHLDSVGYDLYNVGKRPINELMDICKKNSRCVAFNSLGYLKFWVNDEKNFRSVQELQQDEQDGLYIYTQRLEEVIKRNTNKGFLSFQDYNFYPNLDSPGNDLGYVSTKSIEELKELADQNPGCKGFNTIGFLKNEIMPKDKFIIIRSGLYSEGLYVKKCYDQNVDANMSLDKNIDTNKTIRVKLLCNWCDSATLCREWNHMSKGNGKWNNIQITSDNNADFYVIINKPLPNEYYNPLRTIIFHMEPWCSDAGQNWGIKTWGVWAEPDESKFLQVRSHKKFVNNCFWQLGITYDELKATSFKKTKGIRISTICSSKYFDPGHIKRIDFLKFIESKNDPLVQVDIYNTDNQHNFKNYMGPHPVNHKEVGMTPYKYYFMGENNEETNFITEKLWEPLITDTLCFYWGCPNVTEHIDPRTFVLLDLNDFEKSFDIIKKTVTEAGWEKRIEYIRREKQKVLEYYNFFPTLERVICQDFQLSNNMSDEQVLYHKYFKDIIGEKVDNICFFHNCMLDKGPDIFMEYIQKFFNSGLMDSLDYLYIVNLGDPINLAINNNYNDKIKIINYSKDIKLFEMPTLNLIHLFSQFNENTKILYLHSKGVTHNIHTLSNVKDWANYMLYFLVDNHKVCLDLLDTHDTVGCNYLDKPKTHYSGNFWWATSNYIRSLRPIGNRTLTPKEIADKAWWDKREPTWWGRHEAEWWLLSNTNVNKYVLFNSNIDHYKQPFPKELYDTAETKKKLLKLYEFDNHCRIKCVNLERRPDRKANMQKLLESVELLENCDFFKAVDGKKLEPTPELKHLFRHNDFGSRRAFIGCAMSHYVLWQRLLEDESYDNYLILEDDIEFLENCNIKTSINKVFKMLQEDPLLSDWDLVYLGHSIRKKNLEAYNNIYGKQKELIIIKHLTHITVGGTFAYIINKSGAKKLLDYIEQNGIRHGIDYLMFACAHKMNLQHYETVPRLILSDYVDIGNKGVDSDIQYSYDSLF